MAAQIMSLTSCRTVRTSDASYISKADTVYVDKVHERTVHDSIYVDKRDSIYVDRYVDDNNVHHQDKTKYVYVTKYKAKTDTVYVRKDSIAAKKDIVYTNKQTIEQPSKKNSLIRQIEGFLGTLIALAVCLLIALKWKALKEFCAKIYAFIAQILRH